MQSTEKFSIPLCTQFQCTKEVSKKIFTNIIARLVRGMQIFHKIFPATHTYNRYCIGKKKHTNDSKM